jgi:hypothetical protein
MRGEYTSHIWDTGVPHVVDFENARDGWGDTLIPTLTSGIWTEGNDVLSGGTSRQAWLCSIALQEGSLNPGEELMLKDYQLVLELRTHETLSSVSIL